VRTEKELCVNSQFQWEWWRFRCISKELSQFLFISSWTLLNILELTVIRLDLSFEITKSKIKRFSSVTLWQILCQRYRWKDCWLNMLAVSKRLRILYYKYCRASDALSITRCHHIERYTYFLELFLLINLVKKISILIKKWRC
jgi:hypothetical protein